MRIEFVAVLVLIAMASIKLLRCFTKKGGQDRRMFVPASQGCERVGDSDSDSDRFLESQN